ncbi:MAG: transcription-repair coupling factor [Ignavibacteriales bacterium]|nr:transcription-repair coupling factor [Ignavibacteriales bacterium]
MELLKNKIFDSSGFKKLSEEIEKLNNGSSINLRGVGGSMLAFIAANIFEAGQKQVLVISSDEERAEKLRDDCALLCGGQNVCFAGTTSSHLSQLLDLSASISEIDTLKMLTSDKKVIVIAPPSSIIKKFPSAENFKGKIFEIESSKDYKFQNLIQELDAGGFERKNFVESYGDFAVRGGIIDIYSFSGDNPLRLEFWGDTVESIREFDVVSQRSIRELKTASIVPSITDNNPEELQKNITSIFDYFSTDAVIILDEPEIIKKEIDDIINPERLFCFDDIARSLSKFKVILNSNFASDISFIPELKFQLNYQLDTVSQPSFNGNVHLLVEKISTLASEGFEVFLTCDNKEEIIRLKELIQEDTSPELNNDKIKSQIIPESNILNKTYDFNLVYLSETVHSGFIYQSEKIVVFTEHEIFNRLKRRGIFRRRKFKGFSQKEIHRLKPGDYIVHVDHGIGEFAGLTKINVGGAEQEAVKILFLENDTLYVNLNFIDRIQKYSSQEGHIPKLTRLGSPEWERMKSKAKRRIKDIARELILLYARRKKEMGTSFSPDTHWQKELEASFIYEDTIDQATATIDVKHDMESSYPMDRLICGDVGFGKTEVAVRAAFKAVMDGKQAAILVPTTILAIQHYNTFLDRLNRYTTRIENLTRFKSKKEQTKIIEEMKSGSVDIVIGTHRLLSKDIAFKDLGLLIIDEEHRFGVSAKEKLRQLKANVDTLALTATPIPRTLHFSLIGARDLSLINTPPRNRLPIITEIITASEGKQTQWHVVKDAIRKELHRGGQVYFVHDRVQNIDQVADQLKSYVPEAKIHVAHGQMTGHQLEKTMLDFLEKKYNVLVATKIIESGLDIPNVNTIIINRADRFGLAELYQLRGRVGRTNIQAFAYLLVPPLNVLPKHTLRRLSAIEEFTELGSGFNLAMRDLEIRGAGNLLGGEQSGFILEMGFELYERIVREAVEELKQEEFKETFQDSSFKTVDKNLSDSLNLRTETIIDSDIEALIPDFYVESDTERLDIYRRLYKTIDENEVRSIGLELKDRFGDYPEEVENLFYLIEIRLYSSKAGFPKISIKSQILTVTLPDESNIKFYGETSDDDSPFQKLMKKISVDKHRKVNFKQTDKKLVLQINLTQRKKPVEMFDEVKMFLKEMISLFES